MDALAVSAHAYEVALDGDTEGHLEFDHLIKPAEALAGGPAEEFAVRHLNTAEHLHAHGRYNL